MNLIQQVLNLSDIANAIRSIYIDSLIFFSIFLPAFVFLLLHVINNDD